MNAAASVDEDHGSLAHFLRFYGPMRIGARLIEQYQRKFMRAAQLLSGRDQQAQDLGAMHTGFDPAVQMSQRCDRDVVRCLHQGKLRCRLDHPAGTDKLLSRNHLSSVARCLGHVFDDKEPRGCVDGERPLDRRIAQCAGNQVKWTLVFLPRPNVARYLQCFAYGGLFEKWGDNEHFALGWDHCRGGPLGPPPMNACEILQC